MTRALKRMTVQRCQTGEQCDETDIGDAAVAAACADSHVRKRGGDTFGAEDHEADRAFWLGSAPADRSLSAKEQAVDALLSDMKAQADTYYAQSIGYGLVAAGNPEAAESDLFAFCKALPKGGELHSHDFTAASLDSVIDLLIDYQGGEVAICLEEGDKYGCLYAPGVDTDVKTVPLKAALKEGHLDPGTASRDAERRAGPDGPRPGKAWTEGLGQPCGEQDQFTGGWCLPQGNGFQAGIQERRFSVFPRTMTRIANTENNHAEMKHRQRNENPVGAALPARPST